jgi:cell volume regulation protein A
MRFHDGMAWLTQIAMFLTLGLLAFPSQIVGVMGAGVVIAIFLMLVARPVSVFLSLAFSRLGWREKAFVGWVGLRGAVPVILATFPLLAGVPKSQTIFNLVFFIVLFSVLLQGTTLGVVARWLGVEEKTTKEQSGYHYPAEYVPLVGTESRLAEITVGKGSRAGGKSIMELGLPRGALVVLVVRGGDSMVPTGATVVHEGDKLVMVVDEGAREEVAGRL